MKKIIIILTLLFSFGCSKGLKIEQIKDLIIKKEKIDKKWEIINFKIMNQEKNELFPTYNKCLNIDVSYALRLSVDCWDNNRNNSVLDNNIFIKKIKDLLTVEEIQEKIYQKEVCLSQRDINQYIYDDVKAAREKGYVCLIRNLLGKCVKKEKMTIRKTAKYLKKIEKEYNESKNKLKKIKKGKIIEKKGNYLLCEKHGVWFIKN